MKEVFQGPSYKRIENRVVVFHFLFDVFQTSIHHTKYDFKISNISSIFPGSRIYQNVLGFDVQIYFHQKNYKPSPPPPPSSHLSSLWRLFSWIKRLKFLFGCIIHPHIDTTAFIQQAAGPTGLRRPHPVGPPAACSLKISLRRFLEANFQLKSCWKMIFFSKLISISKFPKLISSWL